jgi:hypothetical protein
MPDVGETQLTEADVERRMSDAIRRALNTPSTPAKELVGKTERAIAQRENRIRKAAFYVRLPDPCSASMSRPLRGLLAALANIDSSARLRLVVSMIFAARSGPAGRIAQQRSWKQNATAARRGHRVAGEAQRSSRAAA